MDANGKGFGEMKLRQGLPRRPLTVFLLIVVVHLPG